MADPLAVLVLLGAVAAATSLSVTERGETCAAEASPSEHPNANDVVTAWLNSLNQPSLHR